MTKFFFVSFVSLFFALQAQEAVGQKTSTQQKPTIEDNSLIHGGETSGVDCQWRTPPNGSEDWKKDHIDKVIPGKVVDWSPAKRPKKQNTFVLLLIFISVFLLIIVIFFKRLQIKSEQEPSNA